MTEENSEIPVADGGALRFAQVKKFHQAKIEFVGTVRYDDYITYLRQHGWQWQSPGTVWTKHLTKEGLGPLAWANSEHVAEQEFLELAQMIRKKTGLQR